jgi:predicted phage terminase large subunit-like protein
MFNYKELEVFKRKRSVRREIAGNSHKLFFSIYLSHYVGYPFAPFHSEMFQITEDADNKFSVIVAFRGSGKSTLITLSYVIWSIIGIQKKKFVLILSQTQSQGRQLMTNIRNELEGNDLLKADIGPFQETGDEKGLGTFELSNFGARKNVASAEQSIRGLRHKQHRPDLVICDDVEDLNSVKTKEGRDKTFQWLTGEVIPIGDQNTKYMIIGNLLHEDSLLVKLKNYIENGNIKGNFYSYPLINPEGQVAWPEKFPTEESINEVKSKVGSDSAWYREYLLRIISDTDRLVHPEWIQYYDKIPAEDSGDFLYTATGIDLAISQKESADYTAMVSAKVFGNADTLEVYILPFPVNERLNFPETFELAKEISKELGNGQYTKLFIEEVGYQPALIHHLENNNVPAEGVKVSGQDKRSRLALVTHLIKLGKIRFPRKGAEELIMQLTGFGIEKHDDLADAFSLLLHKILEEDRGGVQFFFFDMPGSSFGRSSPVYDEFEHGPLTLDTKF